MDIVINLNKPPDITSHDAVSIVKKLLKARKAGHAGTLDPMATGVLVICVNRATRLTQFFLSCDKEYSAVMKLGEVTDTQDAQGKIISVSENINVSWGKIDQVFEKFRGAISQFPPMYSAIKHRGKPLYKLARRGVEVERRVRSVYVKRLEISKIELPYIHFNTVCSSGTYVRTLCHDIGECLGTGAHLYSLQRTAVGEFRIEESITIDELKSMTPQTPSVKGIYDIDRALSWMPEARVDSTLARAVSHGAPVRIDDVKGFDFDRDTKNISGVRIKKDSGKLLAVGEYNLQTGVIRMKIVLEPS